MKLREAWRLSGTAYKEVAYRSIEMSRGQSGGLESSSEKDLRKRFNSTMGSAKSSKMAFAVLGLVGSMFPFLEYVITPTPEALISGVSLSLAISLAYIVFYALQILPSFSSGDSYSLLMNLPMRNEDFSLVATLSLIRTFDYIALGTTLVQVSAVWLLTHSAPAASLMLIGAIINIAFAMAIALWFSSIFYKNVSRGTRSTKGTIGKYIFLVGWGVAALSIGFIFNFISYLLPFLTSAILGTFARPTGLLLLILHPFSISFAIADIVYPHLYSTLPLGSRTVIPIPRYLPPVIAYAATLFYVGLGVWISKRTVKSVFNITRGFGVNISRPIATDFFLRLRSPLSAYIVKDLRLASLNPSMAFLYAAPVFEVITLAVITVQFPEMKATAMIVSTMVGCFFTIMICSTLLNTEGAGLQYTMSLPIGARTIIDAKTLIAALTFTPVPFALLAIGVSKTVASNYTLLIPFVEFIAIGAACAGEISFFVRPRGGRKSLRQSQGFSMMAGSDIRRLIESLALAFFVLLVPIVAYAIAYLKTMDHPLSLGIMFVLAAVELGVVLGITRRTT